MMLLAVNYSVLDCKTWLVLFDWSGVSKISVDLNYNIVIGVQEEQKSIKPLVNNLNTP